MNPLDGISASAERTLRIVDQIGTAERDAQAVADGLILNLCTRMEVHTDGLLGVLIESSPISAFPLGRMLLGDAKDAYRFSWSERLRWLNSGFGVLVSGTKPIQDMLTLIDLRNAVTHGGGQLTWSQKKSISKQLELERRLHQVLAVDVEGNFLRYGQPTIQRAKRIAAAYVLKVDSVVQQTYPDLQL